VKEVLKAVNIVKSLGETKILDNVSLVAHRGKIVVIVGPNGAGKTTLLKILALLTPPDEGHIEIDGSLVDFSNEEDKRRMQEKIAYLPQKPPVFTASVYTNIYLPLRLRGIKSGEARRRTEHWLTTLRLSEHAKKNAHKLSGGQKQLLALARALALDPEILLLDEPTSSLAPSTAELVQDILKSYARGKNCYAIVVSHSTAEAKRIADTLHVLVSGRIKATFTGKIPEEEILKWI
jgi:tungstate transport system ATP-binding protein